MERTVLALVLMTLLTYSHALLAQSLGQDCCFHRELDRSWTLTNAPSIFGHGRARDACGNGTHYRCDQCGTHADVAVEESGRLVLGNVTSVWNTEACSTFFLLERQELGKKA